VTRSAATAKGEAKEIKEVRDVKEKKAGVSAGLSLSQRKISADSDAASYPLTAGRVKELLCQAEDSERAAT
jgi:hypothetical protein